MRTGRFGILLALFICVGSLLGQETSRVNPFPEIGDKKDSEVFDMSREVTLSGVVTQVISRPEQAAVPILYFRVDARDPATGTTVNWAVRVKSGLPNGFEGLCGQCLVNDYLPEMSKLTLGMSVIVKGNPAKDQSRRLSLVPSPGPNTIAGIVLL